eukprot:gb/GEZN01006728.1/.p1 GENE.gb/GEZN01006728.1/~~gb/GEZN01006728.1/.p1  ORF type:complete len:414 (-),score=67.24 gb/GEZN01006728.1/:303-1544(-)
MTESISQEQETELRRLLERAKQAIPFLRLDKADEVKTTFEAAVAVLQRSLVNSEVLDLQNKDDEVDNTPAFTRKPTEDGANFGQYDDDNGFSSDGDDDGGSALSGDPPSPRATADPPTFVKALPTHIVNSRAVTRDFSSPSMKRRALGGSAPTSPAATSSTVISIPAAAPGRAAKVGGSSRAPAPGSSRTHTSLGLGLGIRPKEKSGVEPGLRKAMLQKVAPTAGGEIPGRPVTRDFDSPKLGSRKLGGRNLEGEEGDASTVKPSTNNASNRMNDPDNLLSETHSNKPDGLLEAPHSPMQLTANRRLVGLASIGDPLGSPSPSKEAVFQSSRVPKIPGSPGSYIRPLNHPSTRAAELITAKVNLKKLVKQAQRLTPFIRADSFEEVKAKLLATVLLIEESTTVAKKDPPGGGK